MKRHIIVLVVIAALFSACKKSASGGGIGTSSWTFGGTSYSAASVVYSTAGGIGELSAGATGATATSTNGLVFTFITIPTASEQALITDTYAMGTVLVETTNTSGSAFTSYTNGPTNVKANITISGGKISAGFPGTIWLHNINNVNDSLPLTVGNISQN